VRAAWNRGLVTLLLLLPGLAAAQRVDENAVVQAEDAFGLTVGDEEIGLYSSGDARGFSPKDAGNLVIEGLYYDQQTYDPTLRIVQGSVLHVGLSAQSFPLAAPTGVVDYRLRLPGRQLITSISVGGGPYDYGYAEVDSQIPIGERLSVGIGVGYELQPDYNLARNSRGASAGAIVRWQPTENSEIVPFFGWASWVEDHERPIVYLGGSELPPEFEQRKLTGQTWSSWSNDGYDYGLLARVDLAHDWTIRAGAFGSRNLEQSSYYENYYDAEASGAAQYYLSAVPAQLGESYSGELRVSKVLLETTRRHTLQLIARARDRSRLFGGDDERFIASTVIGQVPVVDKPDFAPTERNRTDTRQRNLGLAYALLWKDVGELGLGIQEARVRRTSFDAPSGIMTESEETTTLYNASLAVQLGPRFTLFGSYSRGLEEAGVAPGNAVNRREAAPLILSEQVDAGLRYSIRPGASALIGVFEIKKPYFGLSAANVYEELATVTHRGVEVSLAGEVLPGLNVVAGYVYLDPRLTGEAVDDGTVGPVPVGPIPHVGTLDASFGPASWSGFALEAAAEYQSSYVASQDNVLTVPSTTTVDLGFRYRFDIGRAPVSVRFQAHNVADDRTWHVSSSGEARLTDGRRYTLSLTTDL
jgi:iron complex outermembrane receptor protein